MALPLLIPLAIGAAGLFGAGKAIKAAVDSSDANDLMEDARYMVNTAEENLEESKKATNKMLASYGKKKADALDKQINPFVTLFSQLKNVELTQTDELQKLKVGNFTAVTLAELRHDCSLAAGMLEGLGSGAAGGALTAFGAYSGTMMLASAGTGTAISSLSGVAATNATLAWLGGGTLASGGLGVVGGTMVLGAMVAGPALLIFGSVFGAKASKKLSEAKESYEKAETYKLEVEGVCQRLEMIQQVTNSATEVLSSLRTRLRRANGVLETVIDEHGKDFGSYDDRAKKKVFAAVKYAQLVKAVIDTPILNKDGQLLDTAEKKISDVQAALI